MNKTLTEKLDELKELALKATPSPWHNTGEDQYAPGEFILGGDIPDSADEGLVAIACRYGHHSKDKDNADYIAAVDPDTVLTLIAEMQKLKKENELIQSTVDNAMGDANAFRAHAAKLTRIIQEAYSLFSPVSYTHLTLPTN